MAEGLDIYESRISKPSMNAADELPKLETEFEEIIL